MAVPYLHPRGTRAGLNALAAANNIRPGQVYLITDEQRLAVGLTVSTYEVFSKVSEAGGGGSPAWGSITGTLANQTDLNTVLSGKMSFTNNGFGGADVPYGTVESNAGGWHFIGGYSGYPSELSGDAPSGTNQFWLVGGRTNNNRAKLHTGGALTGFEFTVAPYVGTDVIYHAGNIPTFSSAAKGVVPASGGGTTNFLRADGSWVAPPSGSGGEIADASITYSKIQNVTAGKLLGRRGSTDGVVEEITLADGFIWNPNSNILNVSTYYYDEFSNTGLPGMIPGFNGSNHQQAANELCLTAAGNWVPISGGGGGGGTVTGSIVMVIDGGGTAITPGQFVDIPDLPSNITITGWTLTANAMGSAVITVSSATYANFPTFTAISGTEKPTLTGAQKNQDLSLTSWTTAVSAGSVLRASVDNAAIVTKLTLNIKYTRTA